MAAFVYDGSAERGQHPIWRIFGKEFRSGVPVEVSEEQAKKLRCLPFFFEAIPAPVDEADFDVDVVDEELAAAEAQPVEQPKRKRGRPPGSKNKRKVTADGNENAG